jgi:hypothetical protein
MKKFLILAFAVLFESHLVIASDSICYSKINEINKLEIKIPNGSWIGNDEGLKSEIKYFVVPANNEVHHTFKMGLATFDNNEIATYCKVGNASLFQVASVFYKYEVSNNELFITGGSETLDAALADNNFAKLVQAKPNISCITDRLNQDPIYKIYFTQQENTDRLQVSLVSHVTGQVSDSLEATGTSQGQNIDFKITFVKATTN